MYYGMKLESMKKIQRILEMKRILLLLLLMPSMYCLYAQNYGWEVVGTKMNRPVAGGQIVSDVTTSKIYILGGFSDSLQNPVNWIQEYNYSQQKWNVIGQMKSPRQHFLAGIWGNDILYFGGTNDTSVNRSRFDSWNYKTNQPGSQAVDINEIFSRSYATGHIQENKLYIIGGNPIPQGSSQQIPYIIIYNLLEKAVSYTNEIGSVEQPQEHMTFLYDEDIYIFGGVFNGVKDNIKRFNTAERKLYDVNTKLLEARAGGVAIYNPILKRAFIIGGYNENNTALSSVEEIVIDENGAITIKPFASLKYPRKDFMAVNFGQFIVVFGGRGVDKKVVPFVEVLKENPVSVGIDDNLPERFELYQNYPNPFNPSTIISYNLPATVHVTLKICDILGKEVATLVSEEQQAGNYKVNFSGKRATDNRQLSSGIYFARLTAGEYSMTIKLMLMK